MKESFISKKILLLGVVAFAVVACVGAFIAGFRMTSAVQMAALQAAQSSASSSSPVLSLSITRDPVVGGQAAVRINNAVVVCGTPSYTLNWGDGTIDRSNSASCAQTTPRSTASVTLYHTYAATPFSSSPFAPFVEISVTSGAAASSTWMEVFGPRALGGFMTVAPSSKTVTAVVRSAYDGCDPNPHFSINWGDAASTSVGESGGSLEPGPSFRQPRACSPSQEGPLTETHTYASAGTYLVMFQSLGIAQFAQAMVGR